MSMKIEELAIELGKAQAKLDRAEKKLKPLKDEVAELEKTLLHEMLQRKLEQVATRAKTFAVKRSDIAELTDDKAFFAYVAKKKAWDLVRKQANLGACRVRWEDGIEIPGVKQASRVSLSSTTRRAK